MQILSPPAAYSKRSFGGQATRHRQETALNTMTVDKLALDTLTVDALVAADGDTVPFHIVMTTPRGTVVTLTCQASYDANTGLITLEIPAQHGHKAFPTKSYALSDAVIDDPERN
jgi:hypothetical protein